MNDINVACAKAMYPVENISCYNMFYKLLFLESARVYRVARDTNSELCNKNNTCILNTNIFAFVCENNGADQMRDEHLYFRYIR